MKEINVYKVENAIEDYKNNRSNALIPSIVLSLLVAIITVLVFILSNSLMVKISIIVFCFFSICFIFTFSFTMSPKTTIVSIEYNHQPLSAYVTNSHGRSYLNLHYEGLKYTKEFNRKEDYEIIIGPEFENSDKSTHMPVATEVYFSAIVVANIFGMLGWGLKSNNKCVTLVQNIAEKQIVVVYDLKRNKLAISIE